MTRLILETRDVTKVFGRGSGLVHALRPVNLSLEAGKLILLIGTVWQRQDNPALNSWVHADAGHGLCADLRRQHGECAPGGNLRNPRGNTSGLYFSGMHLFPTLTAVQNVQLALDVRGERGAKARAKSRELLDRLGLGARAKAFPGRTQRRGATTRGNSARARRGPRGHSRG